MKKLVIWILASALTQMAVATLIVDYTGPNANINSRAADSDTTTSDTWNFSDTTALITTASGQNGTIYGGMNTAWSTAAAYAPYFRHNLLNVQVSVNRGAGVDTSLKGMLVWKKDDFLNGGSTNQMGFNAGDTMSVNLVNLVGTTRDIRFVVKQDNQYYVSNARYTGQTNTLFSIDASTNGLGWATISTADYSVGSFGLRNFTNVQAVGIFMDYARTGNQSYVNFDDFQVNASSMIPEPATLGLFVLSGGMVMFMRKMHIIR